MSQRPRTADFFERARTVAATGMFVAGICAIAGSLLDWVAVTPPEILPAAQAPRAVSFNGLDTGDGFVIIAAGAVMVVAAFLLVARGSSAPAVVAAIAAIVIGGIAFADFRAITTDNSDLLREMNRVGELDPGIGIVLVSAGAILGLMSAVAGIAASPRAPDGGRAP